MADGIFPAKLGGKGAESIPVREMRKTSEK